mmetsp:Transcript_22342/g.66582  ORF Transcript_22342/g.66582 Transcript_22342/m.66582 type:complete len:345 (-) Transcript_22342:426-1460(-)
MVKGEDFMSMRQSHVRACTHGRTRAHGRTPEADAVGGGVPHETATATYGQTHALETDGQAYAWTPNGQARPPTPMSSTKSLLQNCFNLCRTAPRVPTHSAQPAPHICTPAVLLLVTPHLHAQHVPTPATLQPAWCITPHLNSPHLPAPPCCSLPSASSPERLRAAPAIGTATAAAAAAVVAAPIAAGVAAEPTGIAALLANKVFMAGTVAFLAAQIGKIFTERYKKGVWDIRNFVAAGGMPSSHSSLCSGITTALAMTQGLGSPLFAAATAFTLVVMYDAMGVRFHAGQHAQVLNRVMYEIADDISLGSIADIQLKEVLGHTPRQVICGGILGVAVGIVYPLLF